MSRTLNIHDIHKRIRGLKSDTSANYINESTFETYVENAISSNNPSRIISTIEKVAREGGTLGQCLSLFDKLYECGTIGQMEKACNYICEESISKTRSAKDANTNLKRKLGRARSKLTTKVSNNIEDAKNAISQALGNMKGNFKANTTQVKHNVKNGLGLGRNKKNANKPSNKDEAYCLCYESMLEALSIYEDCDRILDNYDKISRRFNLEKLFVENTRQNDYQDTIVELCKLLETYDMPNVVRLNTALETAWYGFEQRGIDYDMKGLVETVIQYYIMKEGGAEDCQNILKNSSIIKPEDIPPYMEVIQEEEPEEEEIPDGIIDRTFTVKEINKMMYGEDPVPDVQTEATDFNKIFNDFKKSEDDHKETKLMGLVRKLYTKNVSNIVDETPNFLNWIRIAFVVGGAFAIHPIVGAVVAIGDIFTRLHFERDETEKMIKCFDDEIKKTNNKINSTNDPEEKARLKEYLKGCKDARKKIDAYYETMLSEKEQDSRYSGEEEKDSFSDIKDEIKGDSDNDDEFDFDFDDDDDFDDFEEAATIVPATMNDLAEKLPEKFDRLGFETITNMDIFNADDIENIAKLSVQYPEVWSPDLMEHAISIRLNKIHKGKIVYENTMERYLYTNACENAIKIIRENKYIEPKTVSDYIRQFSCLVESMNAINEIIYAHNNRNIMVEASFKNSLILAGQKLKNAAQKLSDKDKQVSRTIDSSMNVMAKSVDNALTNENREAVIKGRILPPASKIIKLAIANAAVSVFIGPAIAVIGTLGYIGATAAHRKKERQLILDEIDTELKMCEKYMDMAERKEDMKSYKQLMQIQKQLQRQDQRLRYKMKVDFKQNPVDANYRPEKL